MKTNFTRGYIYEEAFSEACRFFIQCMPTLPEHVEASAHELLENYITDGVIDLIRFRNDLTACGAYDSMEDYYDAL